MSSDADLLADRRNLRRKLSLWRLLALLAVVVMVVGGALALTGNVPGGVSQAHIARVTMSGFISGDRRTLDMLSSLETSRASAVLLRIDSPGGTVTGSEAIYEAVRQLAGKKPVVAVVDGVAASGGYIAALAGERIVARQTSPVGSIGVIAQVPNVARLLDMIGVKVEISRSSPLKANPSGLEPTSPEAAAEMARIVADNFEWFRTLVAERRKLSPAELAAVADGRVHSGRRAVALKLVDELGGEREAIAWLEREKGVAASLPVRDWRPRSRSSSFGPWALAEQLARAAGFDQFAAVLGRAAEQPAGVRLDAPLALWQPFGEK